MPEVSESEPRTRIVTFNANGIRAAERKGFFQWLEKEQPDVVCIQETKAQEHQLTAGHFYPDGYHVTYNDAQRKGYSGTAIYSRVTPRKIVSRLGWEPADEEGRYLQYDFAALSVISLYMPSGTSSDAALEKKLGFMERFFEHLRALRRKRRQFVICADWNTCHQNIDLRNWRSNQKNSGFLPIERAWLDRVYDELGYVDAFRVVDREPDRYTWWSNRGQARAKNVGWRLDYHVITPKLAPLVRRADIYTAEDFSDHAPQTMEYAFAIDP